MIIVVEIVTVTERENEVEYKQKWIQISGVN